jgi:hypothetical protein
MFISALCHTDFVIDNWLLMTILRSHVSRRVNVVGPICQESAQAGRDVETRTHRVGIATVNRSWIFFKTSSSSPEATKVIPSSDSVSGCQRSPAHQTYPNPWYRIDQLDQLGASTSRRQRERPTKNIFSTIRAPPRDYYLRS